jgi:hypothetical protein
MRRSVPMMLVILVLTTGCQRAENPADGPQPIAHPSSAATNELDPNDPTILKRPFTAEEIRAEMIEGFSVLLRRSTPETTSLERWTVVKADDEGVEIEYTTVAEDGTLAGEPSIQRSSWIELRDHATFAAETSTREWASRSTAFGELEGWLYRVEREDGTVQEFFFVPTMPGAPVLMGVLEGQNAILELEQLERQRPVGP